VPPGDIDATGCTPSTVGGHTDHGKSTTNLTVADRWGNLVEYTLTIEQTGGNAMVVPGRGFLLNNELTDFNFTGTRARRCSALRTTPWKRRAARVRRPVGSFSPESAEDGTPWTMIKCWTSQKNTFSSPWRIRPYRCGAALGCGAVVGRRGRGPRTRLGLLGRPRPHRGAPLRQLASAVEAGGSDS
jgi:hypothetical protein